MQFISDQRVLVQCLHVREELSTQFTLIVTSQRQKKATPPTEERKYTIVQDARSHLVDQKFWRGVWRLELITFEILAAERLRLMGFDNRLIIDCFANVSNILIWLLSTKDRFRSEKYESNYLDNPFPERSQFILKTNTSQWQKQSKAQDCPSRIVACWQIFLTDKALFFQQPFHSAEDTLCLCARSRNTEVLSYWRC